MLFMIPQLDSFLSTDNLKDFIKLVKEIPAATLDENSKLSIKVRNGDSSAREEMVLKNLRLVLTVILNDKKRYSSYEKIDLLQEGILALIKAVDTYDEEKGAFSTYAKTIIERIITRETINKDRSIRIPVGLVTYINKYNRLVTDYLSDNKEIPDDEEICEILGISTYTLKSIRAASTQATMSLDEPLDDEDGKKSKLDLIGDIDNSYDDIIDSMSSNYLFAYLKDNLKSIEYFVLYYRILKESLSLEEIGKMFGVTKEAVRVVELKTLKKVRYLYDSEYNFKGFLSLETQKYLDKGLLRLRPITPKDVAKYLYLRDRLDPIERKIYKEMCLGRLEYNATTFAREQGMSVDVVRRSEESLRIKMNLLEEDEESFQQFLDNLLIEYKMKILRIDLDIDVRPYLYGPTQNIWESLTYFDFSYALKKSGMGIPENLLKKVQEYFGIVNFRTISKNNLEAKINCLHCGLYESSDVPTDKLYRSFKKNKKRFSEEQSLALNRLFGRLGEAETKENPGFSSMEVKGTALYRKLLMLHFGITNYKSFNFDKEEYLIMRSNIKNSENSWQIKLLDMYFGYEMKSCSVEELATNLGLGYNQTESRLSHARLWLVNEFLGLTSSERLKPNIYKEYLSTHDITFGEPTDMILKMFFIDSKTYEEIAKSFGKTTRDISITITNAIWRIDYRRLGLIIDNPYSKEELLNCLESSQISEEKKILLEDVINSQNDEESKKKYGVRTVIEAMSKLKERALKERVKNIELSREEIKREVECFEHENILSIKGKIVLSMLNGFQNEYNPDGKQYNEQEVASILGNGVSTIFAQKNTSLTHIKAKKCGIEKAINDFIDRNSLETILKDPRVPIDKKEMETLVLFYGFNGSKVHSIEELSTTYGESIYSVKLRIQRTIVNLKRYQNGEIEGFLSYELDVYPYLKYFSRQDRVLLNDLYKNRLTISEIQEKYNLKFAKTQDKLMKLRLWLRAIHKFGPIIGIDFDYFWQHVNDEDIPFYGDKTLAIELFDLVYEQDIPILEVKRKYHPELSTDIIWNYIFWLIIGVEKRKSGIKKVPEMPYEEVRDYFLAHQDEMSLYHKYEYTKFLNTYTNRFISTGNRISIRVAIDILREKEDFIDLGHCDKDTLLKLAKKYRDRLTHNEFYTLLKIGDIHPREFMKTGDKKQVLYLLNELTPHLPLRKSFK